MAKLSNYKKNTLTVHHIEKVSCGGETSLSNAALLTKKAHRILHMCEYKDYILYSDINDFFRRIVEKSKPLDEEMKLESREYKRALAKRIY